MREGKFALRCMSQAQVLARALVSTPPRVKSSPVSVVCRGLGLTW